MVQRRSSIPPNSQMYRVSVQVWDRTTSTRAKDTTRAATLDGPRLSLHGRAGSNRAGEEHRTDSSRRILSHCFCDMISSKCEGLLGLPPEKCTVERMEKEGQREERDPEEGGKQKKEEYREGKGRGKRRKRRKRGNE